MRAIPAGDDDSLLAVPAAVFRHDVCLGADVLQIRNYEKHSKSLSDSDLR